MQSLTILNSKQIKKILSLLQKQFGFKDKLDYVFLQNTKGRVFIVNRDIEKIDLDKIRINSLGLYIVSLKDTGIRLTIEGSQLIGPKAEKNVVEIGEEQVKKWLRGEDLEIKGEFEGFVIVKHKEDFLGSGKFKEGKILNFVSKGRRIKI